MALTLLGPDTPFPPPELALDDPAGLLAVGGDLSLARLEQAYRHGIFPWFSPGQPILWWSPDPRMVLRTDAMALSHSLRKKLSRIARGRLPIQVRMDTDCRAVMRACAAPRQGQPGTWIVPAMQHAYLQWHRAGFVHSIETYLDGELVGGLYGVGIGRMFFGESMFTRVSDASKIALACLVRWLARHGVGLIDCQQETAHLASLGARPIARSDFLAHVRQAAAQPPPPWAPGTLRPDGGWHPLVSWTSP
ncbi:leucyl/phenylalanyl-tRNA--protein transferase [Verticiella sediminum]|uniref:Leucyl/phenylalanyl-tRNA--protein transferase n=1 Tax=Verticiella sediminum TaxID=1247510 RepID=A0A556A927_9BURK|nr:leucyl/phenylalanyl-tRNA--protein transferase [Verticiella sediminum]TSH89389.1 leucyl/phenylalanyl-tRNA--protein transferase [Verticiella sediminum]